jgi:hypothetical protein
MLNYTFHASRVVLKLRKRHRGSGTADKLPNYEGS